MSIQNRRAINNVLLRWVQRHRSMTALFHTRPVHATRPKVQLPHSSTAPVIQAKPMDIHLPTQPDTLGVENPIPSVQLAPPKASPVQQSIPPLRVDSSVKEVKAPPPPKPAPADQPDPGWTRLKAIFRRHQEQENQRDESASPPEQSSGTASAQPALKPDLTQPPVQAASVPKPGSAPLLVQRKADATVAESVPVEDTIPTPQEQIPSAAPDIAHINPPVAAVPGDTQAAVGKAGSPASSKPVLPNPIQSGFEDKSDEAEPFLSNPVPLESVWNVQRTEAPEPIDQPPLLSNQSHHAPAESLKPKPVVQRALADAEPGVSAVEKEDRPAAEPLKLQTESSPDTDVAPPPQAPVEILAPTRPRPAPVNRVANNRAVQRQPQNQMPLEVHDERMIETPIGPLPADLWQLIGQKPPENQPHPAAREPIHSAIQRAESVEVDEEIPKPEASSPSTIKLVDFPAVVQRQPVAADGSVSLEEPGTPPSKEPAAEVEADVDYLARQVYAKIRQRLSTEWERLRRR